LHNVLNDRDGYLADNGMATLARNLGVSEAEVWEVFDRSGQRNPLAARGVANVVRGVSTASECYQRRIWSGLGQLLNKSGAADEDLAELVGRDQGGSRLHARLYWQSAATLTGRLRGGVGYTESKNCPFQSRCADGGKLALWKLLHAGFDVYAFVHDEILIQLPADGAAARAEEARQIMIAAMEAVMGHGVPAACDYVRADCWTKTCRAESRVE
jgi:hypothetical protein